MRCVYQKQIYNVFITSFMSCLAPMVDGERKRENTITETQPHITTAAASSKKSQCTCTRMKICLVFFLCGRNEKSQSLAISHLLFISFFFFFFLPSLIKQNLAGGLYSQLHGTLYGARIQTQRCSCTCSIPAII